MKQVTRLVLLTVTLTGLGGCKTTGDPTKGGLYGWDEEKAKQRQQHLKEIEQRRRATLTMLEQQNIALNSRHEQLEQKLHEAKEHLAGLLRDNLALRTRLAELKQQKQHSEASVEQIYRHHQQLNEQIWHNEQQVQQQIDWAAEAVKKITRANEALVQEIELLIGH